MAILPAMSRTALAGRVTSLQARAAKNGAVVVDAAEQAVEAGAAYALGQAEGRGLVAPDNSGPAAAMVGIGLAAQAFAPNGVVKSGARAIRRAGVTVLSYKAGVKSGLEATAPKR